MLLSSSREAPVRLLGHALEPEELAMAGAGAHVDLLLPRGAELLVLIVTAKQSVPNRALRICNVADAGRSAEELIQYIREPQWDAEQPAYPLGERLHEVVSSSQTLRADQSARTLRVSAVLSACRLVEKRFPATLTLNDLARHCQVAERTLEYGFRQVFATTPISFFRSQRLARTRSALLSSRGATSVGETARAFGFTHMGQYSRDYRRLFGETPSITLARRTAAIAT